METQNEQARIKAENAALRAKQMAALAKAGFEWSGDTLYPPGTPVMECAGDTYRKFHGDWQDSPPAIETIDSLIAAIDGERRQTHIVKVADLSFGDDGRVYDLATGKSWGMETIGWERLCSCLSNLTASDESPERPFFHAGKALGAALGADATELRAFYANRGIGRLTGLYRPGPRQEAEPHIALRTRDLGNGQSLFACVSPSYKVDDGQVLRSMLDYAVFQSAEFRGRGSYNRKTGDVAVSVGMHRERDVIPDVGDVFRIGLTARFNDAGTGGLRLGFDATRVRCINLTTLEATLGGVKRTHRSQTGVVVADFARAVENLEPMFLQFAEDWRLLRTPISGVKLWGARFDTVEEAIQAGVDSGKISATVGNKILVDALFGALELEPGQDLAALVNAVSRAAWDTAITTAIDAHQQAELERSAGNLILVGANAVRESMKMQANA